MAIPDAALATACNAWATANTWVSVFTTAGGTNGAGEASVTRQQTTWSADNKGKNIGSEVTVATPAGTYVEAGVFTAKTGGSFGGSAAFVGGSVTVSGSGASIKVTPTLQIIAA